MFWQFSILLQQHKGLGLLEQKPLGSWLTTL